MRLPQQSGVISSRRFARNTALAMAVSVLLAGSANAASGVWNLSPTDSNWVATGSEANWNTGAATFPGSTSVLTNTDTATFNNASSTTGITINSSTLNIKNITFDTGASAYTIGSTGGNSLLLSSGGVISLASTFSGSNTTETINAPLVLEGATTTTAGTYTISSNSATAANTLTIGGTIKGGTTSTVGLALTGANTGTNKVTGAIQNGSSSALAVTVGVSGASGNISNWILSGNNTYSGLTTITGTNGTNGSTLTLSGDNSGASGGISVAVGTLNVNSAAALGTGTLTLSNGHAILDNTSGGDVTVTTANAIAAGGFAFTGTNNLNLGTGAVTIGNTHITITANKNTLTMGGAFAGGASTYLVKTGAGTLALTGSISYGGTTGVGTNTIAGGTLVLSGDNSLATGGVSVFNSTLNINSATALGTGTLTLNNGANAVLDNTSGSAITVSTAAPQAWAGSYSFTGSSDLNLGTGAVTLSNSPVVTVTAGTLTSGGAIGGGANTLGKTGTGTLVLAGSNTYTGLTTITSGAINYRNATAFGTNSAITVASGGTAQVQGGIAGGTLALKIAGAGASGSTGALENVSGTNSYGGLVQLTAASTISSDAGTLSLTNTGTITGGTFGLTLTGAGNGSIASIIGTTSGTVSKTGAGAWTLSAANTYTGGTGINGGNLVLTNASSTSATGTGAVALGLANATAGTGTLGGTGYSSGALTVTSASHLAAGLNTSGTGNNFGGVGTLHVATAGGATTLTSAALDFDLSNSIGGSNDLITAGGAASLGTLAVTFNETQGTLAIGTFYTLLSATGITGFSTGNITTSFIGTAYTPTYAVNGNSLQVKFAAIPEPASLALLGLGGLGVLARRRKAK